jgi:hypothetical protein
VEEKKTKTGDEVFAEYAEQKVEKFEVLHTSTLQALLSNTVVDA